MLIFLFCFTMVSYFLSAICSEEIEAFYNWVLLFFRLLLQRRFKDKYLSCLAAHNFGAIYFGSSWIEFILRSTSSSWYRAPLCGP
jgi:hypothetical protein